MDDTKEPWEVHGETNANQPPRGESRRREEGRRRSDHSDPPKRRREGAVEEAVDLTGSGDEGPAEPSPPPRNAEPPARPRTTNRAPATQLPPPARARRGADSDEDWKPSPSPPQKRKAEGKAEWKQTQLGAPRHGSFVCSILGCEKQFQDRAALSEHQRIQDHWPRDRESAPDESEAAPMPVPTPAEPSRAVGRGHAASVPSSTPKAARTSASTSVDLDEEPDEPAISMQMRQVELGTFDCGACQVAFSETEIRFYPAEGHQPKGYEEEVLLEMNSLTRIEIDKERGVLCVTGFFGYEIPGQYSSFTRDGAPRRASTHPASGACAQDPSGCPLRRSPWVGPLPFRRRPGRLERGHAALLRHQEEDLL